MIGGASLRGQDGEGEFDAFAVAEEDGGEGAFASGVGKEVAEEFAFGHALGVTIDFDEDIVFLEAGAFGEAMCTVLTKAFDPEGEALGVESALGAGRCVEVLED